MRIFIVIIALLVSHLSCSLADNHKRITPIQNKDKKKMKIENKFTNSLINETSPYLLQHAHNPVNWFPWGKEALEKSRREDKPIFLSIGYSACHWCHVMEKESFENENVAHVLNEHFVSIKVDREERPDLDQIYMDAVQLLTGSGGWPLSVFLTPDRKPFFGGTYFPPENRYGRPGFINLIATIARTWEENRNELLVNSEQLTQAIEKEAETRSIAAEPLKSDILYKAAQELVAVFDAKDGGFGPAPKFPQSMALEILMNEYSRTQEPQFLEAVTTTLDKMAYGGLYDHLGGGFHRYSTDKKWLVPHFEKMLYDNAQLSDSYLKAYQLTGNQQYKTVAKETFDFILREMTDKTGGFHSTIDADSEGEEGAFYIWTFQEIIDILGKKEGTLFCYYYSIEKNGNFDSPEEYHAGQNILHRTTAPSPISYNPGLSPKALQSKINTLRSALYTARDSRQHPGKDDKIITAWNGLMISSFVHGYQILGEQRYLDAAQKAARFILSELYPDNDLLRIYRQGKTKQPAYLDDYANVINALIDLYEATFDLVWIAEAEKLTEKMISNFWDTEEGGFFFAASSQKDLIVRFKQIYDGSVPSGNASGAFALLRLSRLLDKKEYYLKADTLLAVFSSEVTQLPRAYMGLLRAADFYCYPPKEIAFAAKKNSPELNKLLGVLHREFIPNKVIAVIDNCDNSKPNLDEKIPLLKGKVKVSERATAYVCKNFACQKPVTEPAHFKELLSDG